VLFIQMSLAASSRDEMQSNRGFTNLEDPLPLLYETE
jgi:hypothetical protein